MSDNPKIPFDAFGSFLTRSPYLYHIRSEDNQIISFKAKPAQEKLYEIVQEEKKRTKDIYGYEQVKLIVLKGRQLGISTEKAMINMDNMIQVPLYNTLVLAHDDETTGLLYDIYKRCYENIPERVDIVDHEDNVIKANHPIRPETKAKSGKKMEFKMQDEKGRDIGGRLNVRTAGGGDNVGKGITLNAVHLSEVANYDHFRDVLSSTSQALPRKSDIFLMLESTANGVSGKGEGFYKLWEKSEQQWTRYIEGKSNHFDGYRPVFLPWYDDDKYSLPLRGGELTDLEGIDFGTIGKKDFLQREEYLMDEMGLSIEQINWYRWCIKNKCSYDLQEAYRYYPTFPRDAFLASDSCFFNTTELYDLKETLKDEGEREHSIGFIDEDMKFVEDAMGDLKIYDFPDPMYENRYVVSADPSRNVEGADYGAMMVFDRLEQKIVAKWHGRMEEDDLALTMMRIGYFYNHALLIPEGNLSTVVNILKPDGLVPYRGDVFFQLTGNKLKFGYHQDKKTRKDLLDFYKSWIKDHYNKLPDLSTVEEHNDFVKVMKNGTVRPEAQEGSNDDQVFALALCVWGSEKWEEEVAKVNDEGTDYEEIIKVDYSNRRIGKKQSTLGKKRGYKFPKSNARRKKNSHAKLGKR